MKSIYKNSNFAAALKSLVPKRSVPGGIGPLSQKCSAGRKRICKVTGDRKLCAKMASMGMYPGEEINVICSKKDAKCLLRVAGGTVSLDTAMSEKILVESL